MGICFREQSYPSGNDSVRLSGPGELFSEKNAGETPTPPDHLTVRHLRHEIRLQHRIGRRDVRFGDA